MIVVVLGMHGGGTSLVAQMIHEMGVDMNPNRHGRVKWYNNYEDAQFAKVNALILKLARGNWGNPPTRDNLERVAVMSSVQLRMQHIIE